ncbi:hypothetical protein RHSIM_Rhsim12G0055200 [Rhododendron simsii]|uniref:Thioredoxin domain-containing protein n=1 Tax=Rhododendron simsii TaxID=118357 RepID=A0A834G3J1_RHOSS|nr:hypothetical protein RHSIM_Rhsim12G0055200 [Rhododendron simsii]
MRAELPARQNANRAQAVKNSQVLEFHSSTKWEAHFESSKKTSKLMVIYFSASRCGPCRLMEPTFIEYASKYKKVEFIKIDVHELMDVAQEFRVQVMPTFIFVEKGKVLDKITGARKEELQNKIEKHLGYCYLNKVVLKFHSSTKWKAHFKSSKETSKLMVIYFSASRCGPCRLMEPTFIEYASKYKKVEFIKIDVHELMDVAQEFGVRVMPTFIFAQKGKVVDKITGAKKEELENKIEEHLGYCILELK